MRVSRFYATRRDLGKIIFDVHERTEIILREGQAKLIDRRQRESFAGPEGFETGQCKAASCRRISSPMAGLAGRSLVDPS